MKFVEAEVRNAEPILKTNQLQGEAKGELEGFRQVLLKRHSGQEEGIFVAPLDQSSGAMLPKRLQAARYSISLY